MQHTKWYNNARMKHTRWFVCAGARVCAAWLATRVVRVIALVLKHMAEKAPFRVCAYSLAVALRLHLVIVRDSAAWARAHHTQSVRHASAHALHADILVRVYAH